MRATPTRGATSSRSRHTTPSTWSPSSTRRTSRGAGRRSRGARRTKRCRRSRASTARSAPAGSRAACASTRAARCSCPSAGCPPAADARTPTLRAEVLAELERLPLVVRAQPLVAVDDVGRLLGAEELELEEHLAVLEQERHVVGAHLEHGARAALAAEAVVEEARVVGAQLADADVVCD